MHCSGLEVERLGLLASESGEDTLVIMSIVNHRLSTYTLSLVWTLHNSSQTVPSQFGTSEN